MNGEKWMPLQIHDDVNQLEQERDWLAEILSLFCALAFLRLPLDPFISREWLSAAIRGRGAEFWRESARKAVSKGR